MEHIHATPVFGTMGWFISRNLVHDDSVTLFSPESYLPPTLQKESVTTIMPIFQKANSRNR